MKSNIKISTWEKEHYVCYLYLTAGYADGVLLPIELEMAKTKLREFLHAQNPNLFVSIEKVMRDVLKEIEQHSLSEKQETIREMASRFDLDQDLVTDIVSNLTDIIASDDVVDAEEHKTIAFIRAVLQKVA